jgi:hypothetical protein
MCVCLILQAARTLLPDSAAVQWNFYLRFLARNRPDDLFFGEKVRAAKIFSVERKISRRKKLLSRSICAQTILKYALTVDWYHPENSD